MEFYYQQKLAETRKTAGNKESTTNGRFENILDPNSYWLTVE